jgi:hypothetical protein
VDIETKPAGPESPVLYSEEAATAPAAIGTPRFLKIVYMWVVGLGVQAAAQLFFGGEVDVQIVFDGHDLGLQVTPSARLGPDVALGVSPMFSISDADRIGDLTGLGLGVGIDLGVASTGFTVAPNMSKNIFDNATCREGESDDRAFFAGQISGLGFGAGAGLFFSAGWTFMPASVQVR